MALDYRALYETTKAELEKLEAEKNELQVAIGERDKQIGALIQTMNAIAPLIGETPPETPAGGMTDSIRKLMAEAGHPLTAVEIRDRLEAMGFDMKSYSNPLATIHTVLRRLADAGEVETDYELASKGPKKFGIASKGGYAVEGIPGKSIKVGKMIVGAARIVRNRKDGQK
ncbi:MAG TPA: hypothetical protein VKU01_13160 [Bryobacteraceae bacterium]|nr:hypothetical protein [Bryobacteraceae bacterium]